MIDRLDGVGIDLLGEWIAKYRDNEIMTGSLINMRFALDDIGRSIQDLFSDTAKEGRVEMAAIIAGKCLQYRALLERDSRGRIIIPIVGEAYKDASNVLSNVLDDLLTSFNTKIPADIQMVNEKNAGYVWLVLLPHQRW